MSSNMQQLRASTLAEIARKLRAHRGSRTQAQVAASAGKKTATYTFWEGARSEPGAVSLARACLYLNCTPNDILLNRMANPEDTLPEEIYSQLLEISSLLIKMHHSKRRRSPVSPITIFRQFLCEFAVCSGVIATHESNGRSRKRRRAVAANGNGNGKRRNRA